MPPACPEGYEGQLEIRNGLPPNNVIFVDVRLHQYQNVSEVPGGTLGGTISTFDATLVLDMEGQGNVFNGYSRFIQMPVSGEIHWEPRTANLPNQVFAGTVVEISGSIFFDPDFDELHFRTGSDLGLNNTGVTTLTRQGAMGAPFQVDSFLDGLYSLAYIGAAGSDLDNIDASTTDFRRLATCPSGPIPVEETSWGKVKALYE